MKKYLSTKELAVRWSMSSNTLRHWRISNKGPRFSKISGNASYKIEDIEEFEKNIDKDKTSEPEDQ